MITKEEFEDAKADMMPHIRLVADKYPASSCYRSTESPAYHYVIGTYYTPVENGPVKVVLIHGHDSTLPGVKTFGQDPAQLVKCDCGQWRWPSPAQIDATREELRERFSAEHDTLSESDFQESTGFNVDEALSLYVRAMENGKEQEAKHAWSMMAKWFLHGGAEPDWARYEGDYRANFSLILGDPSGRGLKVRIVSTPTSN